SLLFFLAQLPPCSTLFPYTTLFRSGWPFTFFVNTDAVSTGKVFVTWDQLRQMANNGATIANHTTKHNHLPRRDKNETERQWRARDRKSTRLNSSHVKSSYAVFCLKK